MKLGSTFSFYLEILTGVSQGVPDDRTIYSYSPNFEEVALKLSHNRHLIFHWFRINSMVANPAKFQIVFLRSNIDNNKITFMIKNKRVKSRSKVKLLDITTDGKLSFTTHIENFCSTASNRFVSISKNKQIFII